MDAENKEIISFYLENFKFPFKKGDLIDLSCRSKTQSFDRYFVFNTDNIFPRLEVCENALKNWFLCESGKTIAMGTYSKTTIGKEKEKGIFLGEYIPFFKSNLGTIRGIKNSPILAKDWQYLAINAKEDAKRFFEPELKLWLKCFSLNDKKDFWVYFNVFDDDLDYFWGNCLIDFKIKYSKIEKLKEAIFPEQILDVDRKFRNARA